MAGAGAHHLFMAGAETGLRVVIGVSLSVGPGRTHGECSVPVYRQNRVYLFNPYLPPVRPSTPQAWRQNAGAAVRLTQRAGCSTSWEPILFQLFLVNNFYVPNLKLF